MPNEQDNLFTSPADTDLPTVDLGVDTQPSESGTQGDENTNPYTADQASVMGETPVENTAPVESPQASDVAEQPAADFNGQVEVHDDDPTTATAAYPGLDTHISSPSEEAANTGGLGTEAPVEQVPLVTHSGEDTANQLVAPSVIGAPEQSDEDRNAA